MVKYHGGLAKQGELDFSSNINPLAPPGFVIKLIKGCEYSMYPDYTYANLRRTVAAFNGVSDEEVTPVNGASEGLYASLMVARLLGMRRCLIVSPNYGDLEFEEYCRLIGLRVNHHLMPHSDSSYMLGDVKAEGSDVVLLSNPSNPTGILHSRGELIDVINNAGLVIVDEAYINLSVNPSMSLMGSGYGNLIVVRSLTKEIGLPGLRIGYVYTPNAQVMRLMRTVLPSWNVNSCADEVARGVYGRYSSEYVSFLEESRREVARLRDYLVNGLIELGFRVYESAVNFILVEAPIEANRLYEALLNKGIVVRVPKGFVGLGGKHVRIAVRGINDEERLIEEIKRILNGV
ncbi:pyridoxal phosphate-dependent aminotransferase [Caldivirga maquilingensis]|uniref:Aminotransferase n=1 Tax=Caldivirga maquilingensis (strain ATCC 700844 / DSM 13496 / JCM 10307 / IC-167) TaxID=397948 RepID=A8MC51_CALMQ|nr:aminotransferase class I/II-fold pyridoxal phosphate-dependent enzyme [Caldivirga maquilingensis]ABW01357.1 aminotransferase class I and II [Caldivirga maquilingensis IC-167]